MAAVMLEVPDELVEQLGKSAEESQRNLRQAAAFFLCSRGDLTTSQAARLAGLTYTEFLETAARAKVQLVHVDMEELGEEVDRGFTLGCQRVTDHPARESGPG